MIRKDIEKEKIFGERIAVLKSMRIFVLLKWRIKRTFSCQKTFVNNSADDDRKNDLFLIHLLLIKQFRIMNKRFSTLLAAALVAGGMSFNAAADAYTAEDVKDVFIHLGDGANTVLSMTDDGTFSTVSTSAGWKGQVDQLLGTLWQVKATAQTTTGAYTFTFTNRLSGQLLSVKLQSDQKGGGRKALITENEKGGNTVWGWDQTVGLYAVQGDSTFYIGFDTTNDGLTFKAVKGAFNDSETINGTAIKNVAVDVTADVVSFVWIRSMDVHGLCQIWLTPENLWQTVPGRTLRPSGSCRQRRSWSYEARDGCWDPYCFRSQGGTGRRGRIPGTGRRNLRSQGTDSGSLPHDPRRWSFPRRPGAGRSPSRH